MSSEGNKENDKKKKKTDDDGEEHHELSEQEQQIIALMKQQASISPQRALNKQQLQQLMTGEVAEVDKKHAFWDTQVRFLSLMGVVVCVEVPDIFSHHSCVSLLHRNERLFLFSP
jgi:hypothetical protein